MTMWFVRTVQWHTGHQRRQPFFFSNKFQAGSNLGAGAIRKGRPSGEFGTT
jgi:hypothetical protein